MFWATAKRQRQADRFAAGLMLSLWLGTLAVAVVPQLHNLLHADAQSLTHQCFITQIQRSSVLAGSAVVVAPVAPPAAATTISIPDFYFLPAFDYRLSPSRAPPGALSSITVVG